MSLFRSGLATSAFLLGLSPCFGQPLEPRAPQNSNAFPPVFQGLMVDAKGKIVGRIFVEADALLVGPDVLFVHRRVQLVTLAAHHRLPAIYPQREFTEIGGMMSYGQNFVDLARLMGIYAAHVLKGEKPNDIPVMRPTKFEFIINLQTAGLLGITIPPTLLATADEVIE